MMGMNLYIIKSKIFIIDRELPESAIYNNLLDSWSIGHSGTFTSSESIFIL